MKLDRRQFIKAASGLLLAPAIVKAENIMRVVPLKPFHDKFGKTNFNIFQSQDGVWKVSYGFFPTENYSWVRRDTWINGEEWHQMAHYTGRDITDDVEREGILKQDETLAAVMLQRKLDQERLG